MPNAINNITPGIAALAQCNLLARDDHPLSLVKTMIERSFDGFELASQLSPVVTTQQCFDDLLIPADHISRRRSDTFYVDAHHVLRPHTSAHQTEFLRAGVKRFLVSGDVYRRDAIDASHYPAFHQMEGVCVMPAGQSRGETFEHLKASLDRMVDNVFGKVVRRRWVDTTFPFTDPSAEMEIEIANDWLEVLGCGVVQPAIMRNAGLENQTAWAFGLGLERLAMILFGIPDIRLFWSTDERFSAQFANGLAKLQAGKRITFKRFSKNPAVAKDLSLWIDRPDHFSENDLFSVVRETAGDVVESVKHASEYVDPKTGRQSRLFRVEFRGMDRNLTHAEVNEAQDRVRKQVQSALAGVVQVR